MTRRELIRFTRGRARIATSLIQPLLLLFVLGTGLSATVRQGTGGVDFKTFLFPGVLVMPAVYAAVSSTMAIVWDREVGFLRVILTAPVSRYAVVAGKCIGGTIVATAQAGLVLLVAGAVGVPYHPLMLAELVALLMISAFILTAIGMIVASRVKRVQTVQVIFPVLAMPFFFLSGAVYPLAGLPGWLAVLTQLNPLTYTVDLMRRSVTHALPAADAAAMRQMAGTTVQSGSMPVLAVIAILIAVGALALVVAEQGFRRRTTDW